MPPSPPPLSRGSTPIVLGDDDDSDVEVVEPRRGGVLSEEEKLKKVQSEWVSYIYGFYHPEVKIVEKHGRKAQQFRCLKPGCKVTAGVLRYVDTKDAKSTTNLDLLRRNLIFLSFQCLHH